MFLQINDPEPRSGRRRGARSAENTPSPPHRCVALEWFERSPRCKLVVAPAPRPERNHERERVALARLVGSAPSRWVGVAVLGAFFLDTRSSAAEEAELAPIVVTAPAESGASDAIAPASTLGAEVQTEVQSAGARDTARQLEGLSGVAAAPAGPIASLPVVRGLADDRLLVHVDGTALAPACPNHMNSPLSYIDPSRVGRITVWAGVTPVSVGGDSIGGTILVDSIAPRFATREEGWRAEGQLGGLYRSNGNALGYSLRAGAATSWLFGAYDESRSQAENYRAGRSGAPTTGGLAGAAVRSSSYDGAVERTVTLAARHAEHLVRVQLSQQRVAFEGFPNQRMDLTENDNRVAQAHYEVRSRRGALELSGGLQGTHHEMDLGADRFSYGTGMPMVTRARTRSFRGQASLFITEADVARAGVDYQYHTLYDWWPPVGGTMGPNTFWNVDFGQRLRVGTFAEWERAWSPQWTTNVGLRAESVMTDAAAVQGYDNGLLALWGADAARFNASDRRRADRNVDYAALARYAPRRNVALNVAYGQKSRSPSLYQRYPWSTNTMAALMNNTVGDGNGYVGNPALRPEVAHTASLTGEWRDAARRRWELQGSSYFSDVKDYIDARRCDSGQCGVENVTAREGFVRLQYVNRRARLYGADWQGSLVVHESGAVGRIATTGSLGAVRGDNLTTRDGLYHIAPLRGGLTLGWTRRGWSGAAEWAASSAKRHLSRVRNELSTEAFWLVHLRLRYVWRFLQVDLSVENLFDRYYPSPLGGAYLGQGASMTSQGVPWGVALPGPGRSCNTALTLSY